jgi:alanine racemase
MATIPLPHAGAVLHVDLDAVAANWNFLRARHESGPVGAVLKADGYGLGAAPVARRLARAGCRHFFVAHLGEALALRAVVPEAFIGMLGGLLPGTEAELVAHALTPALGSLAEIDLWAAHAQRLGRPLPAMLHVDTGMSRLGLAPGEVDALADDPKRLAGVVASHVMTHLVASEGPGETFNAALAARFARAGAMLPPAPTSVANSSGIFLGREFGSDLARPGAALYGINPVPGDKNPMLPVARLRARVLQVREIPAGASVGYNATWTAARPSRIATVAIGYADGWHRSLSNKGTAFFDGKAVPLVGRVSMDLTTFDMTDHPGIAPGTWLDLICPEHDADAVAAEAGTNGYEVLTSLGHRFARVYRGA